MIARHEGRIVFVVGAIPGERVRVRLIRTARAFSHAEVIEVLEAHPDRRPVEGDWHCGGALYAHMRYERQLEVKSAAIVDAFTRVGRLSVGEDLAIAGSPERGYRMRARLHVKRGRLGFFREGTHDICDAAATGQLLPATEHFVRELAAGLAARADAAIAGVEITENIAADHRAVHVELAQATPIRPERLAWIFRAGELTGVSAGAAGVRPVIIGGTPVVAEPFHALLRECPREAAGKALRRQAHSFFQGNRYLVGRLVDTVISRVPDGRVVDLYAGVGLFGVSLAASGRGEITAVEADPVSARDLWENAALFGDRVRVEHAPVEEFLARRRSEQAARTAIVDPPRTGLSRQAIGGILALRLDRVIYVSCDVATLARDVRRLVEGGYRFGGLEAFDLFPNTPHVECVAVLNR